MPEAPSKQSKGIAVVLKRWSDSLKKSSRSTPLDAGAIDPDTRRELINRVQRWRRGEGRTIAHEDLMRELRHDND